MVLLDPGQDGQHGPKPCWRPVADLQGLWSMTCSRMLRGFGRLFHKPDKNPDVGSGLASSWKVLQGGDRKRKGISGDRVVEAARSETAELARPGWEVLETGWKGMQGCGEAVVWQEGWGRIGRALG